MEIQYQRNLKNSYMVLIEKGQPLNLDGQLAEKMLLRQQIPGLLQWVSMEHEGDMTFWYQITGLQSLSDWLMQHPLDYRFLCSVLARLLALQEELPRYYLKPDHIFLGTDQIFVNTSGDHALFCYEPLWQREPQESLSELMEHLLPQLDHDDKRAVSLGYGLYELCQKPNADVWNFLLSQVQAAESGGQQIQAQTVPGDYDTADPGLSGCRQPAAAKKTKITQPPEAGEAPEIEKTPVAVIRSKQNATVQSDLAEQMHGMGHEMEGDGLVAKVREHVKDQYLKRRDAWQKHPLFVKKEKPLRSEPLYLFEPEDEPAACENPTVYLGTGKRAEGRLTYQGGKAEKSFVIEGETFVIGTASGHADGCLQAMGISRNHARITREDDGYYVEDLNSRNGTYLNGELLSYKQKRRLTSGDHLRFAHEEYIFY